MISDLPPIAHDRDLLDYNTDRPSLILPEYGRSVQNMVNYCQTLEDRSERQRCAETIIKIMCAMHPSDGDESDVQKKLWNHLAAMSDYNLDIDYPYDVEKLSDRSLSRQRIPYPQHPIKLRHYGSIIESLTSKLSEMDDSAERSALVRLVANQMKRNLGFWNIDAMTDEKVLDDLGRLTDGKLSYLPSELNLISDSELMSDIAPTKQGKKKKKKK